MSTIDSHRRASYDGIVIYNATLAQLVEQRFCKAKVVSSNLTGGSEKICTKKSL